MFNSKILSLIFIAWSSLGFAQVPMTGAGKGTPINTVAFSLTFGAERSDTSNSIGPITYNIGGDPSIGLADPNRYVIVEVMARIGATPTVTNVKVNGNNATQVTGAAAAPSALVTDVWYYGPVTTGTTATITVTYGSAAVTSGISTYRIVTATSTPGTAQHNSATVSSSVTAPNVTIPSGGGAIVVAGAIPATATCTNTLSGGTIIEDANTDVGGGRYIVTGHDVGSSGSVGYTNTISGTACLLTTLAISAVPWGP